MIDVKKLITGFLILATAAGASGIILSFISGPSASAQSPLAPQIGTLGLNATSSAIGSNAFVDTGSLQGNAAEVLTDVDTSSTQTAASDPNNITNAFANSFLNGLVSANPNGAITQASGSVAFNPPNTASVAAAIAADPAVQNFKTPDWDTEVDEQPIKTLPNATPAQVAAYSASLNAIMNKYFVSTEIQNLLSGQTTDPATLTYVNTQVNGALNDTLALNVPSSLVGFQKSLVRVLVYEKEASNLNQIAATDPVRASLIIQDEQTEYTSAITALQNQMKSAATVGLLFGKQQSASVPFIAQLFGVKPAQALFGVGDISFDPATFGELVITYIQDTIVQILKNTLVSLIQRKVLTWIQGSGAPKFVTSFASQMVTSFQNAALSELNTDISCVPTYQQSALRTLMSTPAVSVSGGPAQNTFCSSQFQGQLGNNLQHLGNLYNNFTNFNDYMSLFQPTGNGWSNIMNIQDTALAAGSSKQQAKTTQNIAQQGWTGSQVCDDGSDPDNGDHQECDGVTVTDAELNCTDGSTPDVGICQNGDQATCDDTTIPDIVPNDGSCADGSDPTITSPGQVTGQAFNTSIQSGSDDITNANSIAGILNALLSSLLNTLAQNAINYASRAVNSTLTDSGVVGVPPASLKPTTPTSTISAVQCLPSIQASVFSTSTFSADATLSAGGGALDTNCATNNTCPSTENPDGTPIYNWTAPGSDQAASGTPLVGPGIDVTYPAPGQYFATVTASTDNTNATCEIDVQ